MEGLLAGGLRRLGQIQRMSKMSKNKPRLGGGTRRGFCELSRERYLLVLFIGLFDLGDGGTRPNDRPFTKGVAGKGVAEKLS